MKTLAIIDAQMRSTHLPGKVLRSLAERPVLWHVIHRLRQCASVDEIAISTTVSPVDDAIADFGAENETSVYRGDEDDVVGRVSDIVADRDVRNVVVLRGDMPLLDPAYIDFMVDALERENADLVVPKVGMDSNHAGMEFLSGFAVKKLNDATEGNSAARLTIADYLKRHNGMVKVANVDLEDHYTFPGIHVALGDGVDLERAETIVEELGSPMAQVQFGDVIELLQRREDLCAPLNVETGGLWQQMQATVVMRCDAGASRGYGSLMRCLSIATILRDSMGLKVHFAMAESAEGDAGPSLVEENGFALEVWPKTHSEADWLNSLSVKVKPSALIFDVDTDLSREEISSIAGDEMFVATIDDMTQRRLAADAAFYPPSPQAERLRWMGSKTDVHNGWQWVAMSPQFSRRKGREVHDQTAALERAMATPGEEVPRVLISFGGADPKGLTWKVACQLQNMLDKRRRLSKTPFEATFVLGPGTQNASMSIARLASLDKGFNAVCAPEDFADLAEEHDLAIVSFGVASFELTHLGLPSVMACLDEEQVERATAFETAGVAKVVRVDPEGAIDGLVEGLIDWLDAPSERRHASNRAQSLLDGGGAYRIAEIVADGARQSQIQIEHKEAHAG